MAQLPQLKLQSPHSGHGAHRLGDSDSPGQDSAPRGSYVEGDLPYQPGTGGPKLPDSVSYDRLRTQLHACSAPEGPKEPLTPLVLATGSQCWKLKERLWMAQSPLIGSCG